MEVHVAEPMHHLYSCCHDSCVVGATKMSKDKGGWENMLADIHRILHLVLLIVKILLYLSWSGHSDHLERSVHTLLPRPPCYQFSNNVLFECLTISQTVRYYLQISVYLYLWSSLIPDKMIVGSITAYWEEFCFTTVLQGHPWVRLSCHNCQLLSSSSTSYRNIYITSPFRPLPPISQLVLGNFSMGPGCRLRGKKQCNKNRAHGNLDYLFMQLACTFRTCLNPVLYIPLSLDDRVISCMPKFMGWWIRHFVMGITGHVPNWWAWMQYLLRTSSQLKADFQENSYL